MSIRLSTEEIDEIVQSPFIQTLKDELGISVYTVNKMNPTGTAFAMIDCLVPFRKKNNGNDMPAFTTRVSDALAARNIEGEFLPIYGRRVPLVLSANNEHKEVYVTVVKLLKIYGATINRIIFYHESTLVKS